MARFNLHAIRLLLFFVLAFNIICRHDVTGETVESSEAGKTSGRSFLEGIIKKITKTEPPHKNPPSIPLDPFDIIRDDYPLPNGLKSPHSEYDYVIVGAGSAGSVLASRLTEDPNVTVLLIEVGKPENLLTDIPVIAPYFQLTDYSWPYHMEPQANVCMGMENERCYWPRGRAVGGTSVINYMIYTRGRPEEWNRIERDGNYDWSYDSVLRYFMKSERAYLQGIERSGFRGRSGEMPIQFPRHRTRLIDTFLEAGRSLGHPTIDYNSPYELGFGYVQTNTDNGKRLSAAKVFLHPKKNRANLHILPETTATKVLIDSSTKTATGVEYYRNKKMNIVKVRREVILSAGPIASPQLLMLSGIGPKAHLANHSIPLIQDLQVGRKLYDHITFPGIVFTLNTTGVSINEEKASSFRNLLSWLQYGDTLICLPGAVEGIGYIRTGVSKDSEEIPDIELISIGGSFLSDGGSVGSKAVRRGMKITPKVFNTAFGPIDDNRDTWSAFTMLLHPKSSGRIELRDNNPFSHPLLYGNYLTEPQDVATFIAGIRHVLALGATPAFQRYGAKIHKAKYPACPSLEFDTDEYWECALRTLTATLHHQIATCRMGPESDPDAVVDPELRVHGVKRLRVVDSSILPRTLSVHTHAPAVMIGEKAADMIKLAWN